MNDWKRADKGRAHREISGGVLIYDPVNKRLDIFFDGAHHIRCEGTIELLDPLTEIELDECLGSEVCEACGGVGSVHVITGDAIQLRGCRDCGGGGKTRKREAA